MTEKLITGNTKADTPYVLFTLGLNYKDTSTFVPCSAFGKTAEMVKEHLGKGSHITVEGHLTTSENKKSGHQDLSVVVDTFHFLDKKETKKK